MRWKFIIGILAALFLFFAYDFADRQFRLGNVRVDGNETHEFFLNTDEELLLNSVLDQPYYYLDRGRQSFVFVSADGKYVLKFFDIRRYRPGWPTLFSSSSPARMQRKLKRLFQGYRLAYERDRDHAAIIFQQLVPNPALKKETVLFDRFGFKHVIVLGQVPFIIQRKGVPTREELSDLLRKGDVGNAQRRLRQILDMYADEYKRGLFDRDHNFMYNTGFVEDKPIRLDVGRLRADESYKEADIARSDLEKIAFERTEGWLMRHFPQYRDTIIQDMHEKVEEIL